MRRSPVGLPNDAYHEGNQSRLPQSTSEGTSSAPAASIDALEPPGRRDILSPRRRATESKREPSDGSARRAMPGSIACFHALVCNSLRGLYKMRTIPPYLAWPLPSPYSALPRGNRWS